jgi:hypothetical protein
MLEVGKAYRRNDGTVVEITSRVKDYDAESFPFLNAAGNWYHEQTGQQLHSTNKPVEYLENLRRTHGTTPVVWIGDTDVWLKQYVNGETAESLEDIGNHEPLWKTVLE